MTPSEVSVSQRIAGSSWASAVETVSALSCCVSGWSHTFRGKIRIPEVYFVCSFLKGCVCFQRIHTGWLGRCCQLESEERQKGNPLKAFAVNCAGNNGNGRMLEWKLESTVRFPLWICDSSEEVWEMRILKGRHWMPCRQPLTAPRFLIRLNKLSLTSS